MSITCPYCGKQNNVFAQTNGRGEPKDGDASLCASCHCVAIFVVSPFGMSIRAPTEEEMVRIYEDPEIRRAQAAMEPGADPDATVRKLRREADPDPAHVRSVIDTVRAKPLEHRLPCGCEGESIDGAFVLRPCSPTCEHYTQVKEMLAQEGKPLVLVWEGDMN